MDALLYKDYILAPLFVKYVSDRAGQPDALIKAPNGTSFAEMKALRGSRHIGEGVNNGGGSVSADELFHRSPKKVPVSSRCVYG